MTPYEIIRIIGGGLADGDSERTECPWCRGGMTREQSFIVSREGNTLKYTCFRATCDNPSSGALSLSGAPTKLAPVKQKPAARDYFQATYLMEPETRDWLYDKYELSPKQCDEYRLKQDEEGKLVIPIYNADGVQQGHVVKRGKHHTSGPKALTYHGRSSDGLAWYLGQPSTPPPELPQGTIQIKKFYDTSLVMVEDALSAMKANTYVNSLALLGTWLNPEQALLVAQRGFERVFLALDADATGKAFKLAQRLRGVLPNIRVMILEKDMKDMDYASIAHLLSIHHKRI